MLFIYIFLIILVIVLVSSIYFLLKEDTKDNFKDIEKISDDDLKFIVKKNNVEVDIFLEGLKSLEIKIDLLKHFKSELGKLIVGLDELKNSIIVAILTNGHVLVEGVPGLAKTKTILSISKILDLKFSRIQFTPDMLPSDILGTQIYNQKNQDFEIKLGPVFTNILLADEINRATPKVQSALLEAMQERKINITGKEFYLPEPFFVLATQNPLEQEGTYPLPEAQLDRFLFKVIVKYPSKEEEKKVLDVIEGEDNIVLNKLISKAELLDLQKNVKQVYISDILKQYIINLVDVTRKPDSKIIYGLSPRASISMMNAAKVVAFLNGRDFVEYSDIQKVALLVSRHRIAISYDAKIDGYTPDDILLEKFIKVNF